MCDDFDEKIRTEMRKTASPLPKSYESKIETVMNNLPADSGRMGIQLRGVIILVVCLLIGTTTVVAAVKSYWQQRLESMSAEEIEQIDSKVQESEGEGDRYSRPLSQTEEERRERLNGQYERDMVFPQGTMKQVDTVSEVDKGEFCYCYENSMMYLPEHELTDEQLLQMIDFQHVRDYSVKKSNKDKTNKEPAPDVSLSESEAEKLASDYIYRLYGLDTSTAAVEKKAGNTEGEVKEGKAVYTFVFEDTDWNYSICVDIHADSGDLETLEVIYKEDEDQEFHAKIDEEEYVAQGKKIENFAQYLAPDRTIEDITVSYLYQKGNRLWGDVKYYLVDSNGDGFILLYRADIEQFYKIYHFEDYEEYMRKEEKNDKTLKEECGVVRKRLAIK